MKVGIEVGNENTNIIILRDNNDILDVKELSVGLNSSDLDIINSIKSEILKSKHNGKIKCGVVVPEDSVYTRKFETDLVKYSVMRTNIKYEFNDYVNGSMDDYIYDYMVIKQVDNGKYRVMASALRKVVLDRIVKIMSGCRLKLVNVISTECAYIEMIKSLLKSNINNMNGICFINIKGDKIKLVFFSKEEYMTSRIIDINNKDSYESKVVTEIRRAISFYSFSNPGEELSHIYISMDNGDRIYKELVDELGIQVEWMGDLVYNKGVYYNKYALALGGLLGVQ